MGDGFWSRPPAPNYASPGIIKRQLLESDINPQRETFSQGMVHYLPRGDAHVGLHAVKDTKTTGASYDQYLQNVMPSFSSAEETRGAIGGVSDLHVEEPSGSMPHGFGIALGGQIHADPVSWAGPPGAEAQLPQEASKTLFVEGLPPDCTEREVAHIFHPFAGFKEVRLVIKDPEHHAAGKLVLCFVDFVDTTCAMSAMNALQGYKVDANDRGSPFLRLQFARNPAQGPATEHALEEMNTMS